MDGTLWILFAAVAAVLPAALVHELVRAGVALLLTRGTVCVLLGAGGARRSIRAGRLLVGVTAHPWWGGECLHAPASARRAAAVTLSGPLAADLACVAAVAVAVASPRHPALQTALAAFAAVALVRACADLAAVARDVTGVRHRRLATGAAAAGTALPAR